MTDFSRFGRYEVLDELGTGAMGKVYLAVDPLIDRMVAVKVIRADLLEPAERAEFLARFRLEVQAAARCAHPNIVAVHDFADHEAMPYIVMEHVAGRSFSVILRGDPAERAALAPVLAQGMLAVLEGLRAAHALDVIHRDIKPGNVMITPRGQIKITDFGIAKFGGHDLTQVGGVVGTPAYMSPEQARGQPVDARTDLFSVAAILYEILLGQAPFAGRNMTDTLVRLTGPEPADLGRLRGNAMGEVLARGLAKDAAARFATADDFIRALAPALAVEKAGFGATPPHPHRAHPAPDRPAQQAPQPAAPASEPLGRLAALRGRVSGAQTVPVPQVPVLQVPLPQGPVPQVPVPQVPLPHVPLPLAPPRLARPAPPSKPTPAMQPPLPPAGFQLSAAQLAGASATLTFIVGPIARLLVAKASAQAGSADEFVALVCAHATGSESVELRRRLTALF